MAIRISNDSIARILQLLPNNAALGCYPKLSVLVLTHVSKNR